MRQKIVIMGAAGRDFHNFNTLFRDNRAYEVVAFTAAQIPGIENRLYPPELAGDLYPEGILIYPESRLAELIRNKKVDCALFSYSDISHVELMHKASLVLACGADFMLIAPQKTMLKSQKPVLSVCAVRTGSGKSQTTRKICQILQDRGKKPVVVRHPMPYGDLKSQILQRFASRRDLDKNRCTVEEREEYEPLVDQKIIVYAGIDYKLILEAAQKEADVIVWDGGNNDLPFFRPNLHVVLFDPLRAGHERLYYPGETNMLLAQIAIINKIDAALPEQIEAVKRTIGLFAPDIPVVLARSPAVPSDPKAIRGQRVLVVEDGPTITHGEMGFGAGLVAAKEFGAAQIVDPRPYAVGSIKEVYEKFAHIGPVLPAMGYSNQQLSDLKETIERAVCDLVLYATPIDLPHLISLAKPAIKIRYDYQDAGTPTLEELVDGWLKGQKS